MDIKKYFNKKTYKTAILSAMALIESILPFSYSHAQQIPKRIDIHDYSTETTMPKISEKDLLENKISKTNQENTQNNKKEDINELYKQIKYYQTQIYNKMLKENQRTEINDEEVIFRRLYTSKDFSQDSFPGTKIEILKTNKFNTIIITDYQGEVQAYFDFNCDGLKMPESKTHKKSGKYDGYLEYNANFERIDKKYVQENNLLNEQTKKECNQKFLDILIKINDLYIKKINENLEENK